MYVEEEPTWKNTTEITVIFRKPPCQVTQEELKAASTSFEPFTLIATTNINEDKRDLRDLIASIEILMRIGERTWCSDMEFNLSTIDG